MTVLIIAVLTVLVVSAACSLSEASIYAVRMAYIRRLVESGRHAGRRLRGFKENMERPITAILIVNTAANTAGAAVAGAQAGIVFGPQALFWFSAAFTLAVLVFSEIIPKVVGVGYNRVIAPLVAGPVSAMVVALYPAVWLSTVFSRMLSGGKKAPLAPEDEVWQFAALSAEEGSILPVEAALVKNVLRLNEVKAVEIMTPESVVFRVSSDARVRDLKDSAGELPYSRIPIEDAERKGTWHGIVLRRDVLNCITKGELDVPVRSLAQHLLHVPENALGHDLLHAFLRRRRHIFGVTNTSGALVGIVTLEDVLEALIGEEIVDETDIVVDMREGVTDI